METKTNVMRILDGLKLDYKAYQYTTDVAISGIEVAQMLSLPQERIFKTLVTVAKSKKYCVFMIPVAEELNLKKAAQAADEKAIEMIKAKELLPLTGYVHGGCSPIGMKKPFPVFLDASATKLDAIIFSAGKIGFQVGISIATLQQVVPVIIAELI